MVARIAVLSSCLFTWSLILESQTPERTRRECPDAYALDFVKHQIAYENTEQLHPFRDLPSIHVDVWTRGAVTVFYIRDYVKGAVPPNQRLLYMFDSNGRNEPGVCLPDEAEDVCLDKVINLGNADKAPTCTATIDLRSIPPWKPSANDAAKRQIARELRAEIETLYPISKEILIRDFNVKRPADHLPHQSGTRLFPRLQFSGKRENLIAKVGICSATFPDPV